MADIALFSYISRYKDHVVANEELKFLFKYGFVMNILLILIDILGITRGRRTSGTSRSPRTNGT